uniref:Ig-like domain-containing protein n=1 Tax=Pundamilia nyererei TaxID=303518 RepID=A0A3B4GY22_9CICH
FSLLDQKNITAGQNVILPCRARDNNIPIIVVEWSRADLGKESVLMYRDKQLDPDHQHASFKNRVDLQDREMKDGDVSLILKDVTIDDAGTYECRVFRRRTNRRKRANLKTPPISIITLTVVDPPAQPSPISCKTKLTFSIFVLSLSTYVFMTFFPFSL